MKKYWVNIHTLFALIVLVAISGGLYVLKLQKEIQNKETINKEVLEEKLKLFEDYKTQEEERVKQQEGQTVLLQKQLTDLKNRPPETKVITISTDPSENISGIVKKWGKRIAYIECIPFYDNYTVTGSATIIGGSRILALTNAHVITDENGYALKTCKVLVNNEKVYTVTNSEGNLKMNKSATDDWGSIEMPKDEYLSSLASTPISNCVDGASNSYNVEIGDKLIILGYPTIGSESGITVTEGIISGIDDKYYITSAKIDHGNSGGAALRIKDGCYLGLPTSSVVGSIESLGRILKAKVILK